MINKTGFLPLFSIILLILCSCSPVPTQTVIPGIEQTLAVRTLVATQKLLYIATATPTPYQASVTPTATAANTTWSDSSLMTEQTPVPSLTPFVNNHSSFSDMEKCINRAEFVKDVTISDQSKMKSGQRFTKVWRVRNSGSCIWTPGYSLIFSKGDRMNGLSPKPIGVEVLPGDTIDLSIDLIAPRNPNYYQGNWMLQDENGVLFGPGSGKINYVWVSIVVGSNRDFNGILGDVCGGRG